MAGASRNPDPAYVHAVRARFLVDECFEVVAHGFFPQIVQLSVNTAVAVNSYRATG